MFLEVDGDQVTAVELSGDLAVSSVTFDAGTVRDSLQAALDGFRQRRSDPPLEVSLVPPGFRFRRVDVVAEDFEDRSRLEAVVLDGSDFVPAVWLPSARPDEGYTAPGYALAVAPELVEELRVALSGLRYHLLLSPSAVPGDGVWVGVHTSCSILSVVRDGRLVHSRQLPCGGLSTVAALVDPEDPRRGLTSTVAALVSESESPLVTAELGRFYRALARVVAGELQGLPDVPADVQVSFLGVGAVPRLVEDAARNHAFRVGLDERLLQALTYLPVSRRMPSLAALSSALLIPPQLSQQTPAAPEPPKRRSLLAPVLAAAAAFAAASVGMFLLADAVLAGQRLESRLNDLPPHVAAAADLGRFLDEGGGHPDAALLRTLPGLRTGDLHISGLLWEEGSLILRLSGPAAAADIPALLPRLREELPSGRDIRMLALEGDGEAVTVVLEVTR